MRAISRLAGVVLALWLPFGLAAAETLKPVDEAGKDPALAQMIETLVKAADARDFKPFEEALSPNAISSFSGDDGVKGFREVYRIDDPDTTFYADFKKAVTRGGAFMSKTEFAAPYVYAKWPDNRDSFTSVAAIGPKTSLYAAPKDGAKVVADVTHQILELIETDPEDPGVGPDGWIHVKAGKKTGYVKTSETLSPLDYRAVFQKTANRWWLGAFVAGD